MKTTTKIKKRILLFIFITATVGFLMQVSAQPTPLPEKVVRFKTAIGNGDKITLTVTKWAPNDEIWVHCGDCEYTLHDADEKEYIVNNNVEEFKIYGNIKDLNIPNAKITEIDVSGNDLIRDLRLEGNDLTSLDLINLTEKFRTLWCPNNSGLTSINLSSNKNLSRIYLHGCNNLSTIVLPEPKSILIKLALTSVKLPVLDLTGCSNLEELEIARNPALTAVTLTGCDKLWKIVAFRCPNLTTADFSALKNLKELNCGMTKIANLELNSDSLYSLECPKMGLSDNFKLNKVNNNGLKVVAINCTENKLRGVVLDNFIEGLSNGRNAKNESGRFSFTNVNDTGNIITRIQAKAVEEKGWRPLYHDGSKWGALKSSSVLVANLYLSGNSSTLGNNNPALAPEMHKNNKSHVWIGTLSNSVPFVVLGKQNSLPVFNPIAGETDITKITSLQYSGIIGNALSVPSEGIYCVKANFLSDTEQPVIVASVIADNRIKLKGEWNSDDFSAAEAAAIAAISGGVLPSPSDIKLDLTSSSLADSTAFGGFIQELFTYELAVVANQMTTICLPFTADLIVPEGAEYKLQEFTGVDSFTNVPLQAVSGLEANKPYVLTSSKSGVYTFKAKNGAIPTAIPISRDGTNYSFVGTYKTLSFDAEKTYYIAEDTIFRKLSEGERISPYQCYFSSVLPDTPDELSIGDISLNLRNYFDSNKLEIFPVEDGIIIKMLSPGTVEIYNTLGSLVFVEKLNEGSTFIPLTVGVYIVNGLKILVR